VGSSKAKSLYIARVSIEQFFLRNKVVWFWTFSEPGRKEGEPLWTKDEAEAHFKPFRDLCARRGVDLLVVWERQKRGAWHPHCLVNHYIDVNQLRPWMVARGWGQQMRADIVGGGQISTGGRNGRGVWRPQWEGGGRIISYLTKYLTKGFGSSTDRAAAAKKKCFSGSVSVKQGTTNFKWMPEERPGAYLWSWGRELFSQLNGHPPTFRNIGEVIRLGVEHSGWANVDPWWTFNFRGG